MIPRNFLTNNRRVTILLVDDDPDCRMLIRDAITHRHPESDVREVSNGQDALDYLFRWGRFASAPRPNLIYLDIEMPGISGQEVLKVIKAEPDLRDITVVMMTGLDDETEKLRAAANGANGYTLKPADPLALMKCVQQATDYWLHVHQFSQGGQPGDHLLDA